MEVKETHPIVEISITAEPTVSELSNNASFTVLEGDGKAYVARQYESADGKYKVQLYSAGVQLLQITDYPAHEFNHLLEGQIETTDADGTVNLYSAGDRFMLPKGFTGLWRQVSPIKKITTFYYE